jgi:hypothetical protein
MVLTKVAVIIFLITSALNLEVKSFNFKTIHPRCFLDDKNHSRIKHSSSFIQYHVNMFRANRPSSGWQECKICSGVFMLYSC